MKIRIATRTSPLALAQTQQVMTALQEKIPTLTVTIVARVTAGDNIQNRPLAAFGGKGLFVKALEETLLEDNADIAMHSLKDVPPTLEPAFCIPAVLRRQSPHDAFVSVRYNSLIALPKGAVVGTSSVRRQAALKYTRPELVIKMIRGNVDTRLGKLALGEYDALILAEAGLNRLGLARQIKEIMPLNTFTPAVGQGVIAVECLKSRQDLVELLAGINDQKTYQLILAERAMNRALMASCTSPIGSFAQEVNGQLYLMGVVWHSDGHARIETHQIGSTSEAEKIGEMAAQDLVRQGALKLLGIERGHNQPSQ